MKLPMQPIIRDDDGSARFRQNGIVRWMVDSGPFKLSQLIDLPVSAEEREQFLQLIGYSVDGFTELSFVRPEAVRAVEAASKSA